MKIDEMITSAEIFAREFINNITDQTTTEASKQAYFVDNQDKLQKYMGALTSLVTKIGDTVDADEDDLAMKAKAEGLLTDLKQTIEQFQKSLEISENTTDADTTPQVTVENLQDAAKNNKTTQKMVKDINDIAQQQSAASKMPFDYALVCDGTVNLITAHTKEELNKTINALVNQPNVNYKAIDLFQIQATPIVLKKKTILTV